MGLTATVLPISDVGDEAIGLTATVLPISDVGAAGAAATVLPMSEEGAGAEAGNRLPQPVQNFALASALLPHLVQNLKPDCACEGALAAGCWGADWN